MTTLTVHMSTMRSTLPVLTPCFEPFERQHSLDHGESVNGAADAFFDRHAAPPDSIAKSSTAVTIRWPGSASCKRVRWFATSSVARASTDAASTGTV